MKTYDIIYMDPPWRYANTVRSGSGVQRNLEDHQYPTMKDEELMELPVNDMASTDALLYMWVGSPILERAIAIAKHWGFDYSTIAFVWDKQLRNPGHYTMSQVEICLVFKKGKIPQPRGARNVKQFLTEKRREHSRKPDEVRRRIEQMHPTQSKFEMFARTSTPGWDVWGNETSKFDEHKPDLTKLF